MERSQAELLLNKYNSGEASEMESVILESWYADQGLKSSLFNGDIDYESKRQKILGKIQAHRVVQPRRISLWPRIAAVAFIALGVSVGGYFYSNQSSEQGQTSAYVNDVAPGKSGATLTLASGKQIRLADARNGELARETGVVITKGADGILAYEISGADGEGNQINTISTSRGETYRLRLPDGTAVWLNAASSLSYAPALKKDGLRMVELSGEAYFEVAKDKSHPFIVKTDKQSIEVLGTHFNVNAYSDEAVVKTTLLEGSILLNHSLVLKPGRQGTLSKAGKIKVEVVDVAEVVAWKNGKFIFNSEDIACVMRKLSRWYDVEVVDDGDLPLTTFTGVISRYDDISKILNMINVTGAVHLKLEERRIIIMQ